jgi:protein SCO1/2
MRAHCIVLILRHNSYVSRWVAFVIVAGICFGKPQRYAMSGLVLEIDEAHQTVTVSHESIPDYMEAMAMPFHVRPAKALATLHPGDGIACTLVVNKNSSWIEDLRVVKFDSAERDPAQARRLKLLGSVIDKSAAPVLKPGDTVPDFTLIDQTNTPVRLSQFVGKVVAINFVYTRCPLPDYCFRLSNNFGRLQKRFEKNPDLILLTVTFDPVNDRPEVLKRYSQIWKADAAMWHFLTGPLADVQRLCGMFGVGVWQDEGLYTHSLQTAIVDRQGRLVANIEGNRYTAQQLGDLVQTTLKRRSYR